jgi:hypothetical protein
MSQQEKSDSSPDGFPMVMGSRGRAFVMGCPLITEPMRKSGLEWIKRWKKGLVLGTPTQCVANLVVQGAISEGAMQLFTRSEEGLWKRSWTQNEVTHIEDLLKGLGKLPLGIIQGNEEETIEAVGDVEVRLVPLCSSWSIKPLVNLKKNVGPENFSIIPSDWTPAIQWPFPDDVTQKSADGVNLDRVNLLLLHAVLDEVSRCWRFFRRGNQKDFGLPPLLG